MAHNSLYPAFAILYYTFSNLTHKMTIPLSAPQSWVVGEDPELVLKNGVAGQFSASMDTLVGHLRDVHGATTEFNRAEFWGYPDSESDPVWVYSHPLALAGTAASGGTQSAQFTITFRTAGGGIYRLVQMEQSTVFPVNIRNSVPIGNGPLDDIVDYAVSPTSCIRGRDGEALVVGINYTSKTNDAIRKRRLGL